MKLEITNKKIIDFYENNKEIDIESVNLILIDIYVKNCRFNKNKHE